MKKLSPLQYQILDRLFFTEPFSRLMEEIDAPRNNLAADLKELIVQGFVQSMEYDEKRQGYKKSLYYDSDDMAAFHYRVTSMGIEAYENRPK